jgi:hypothetical protein
MATCVIIDGNNLEHYLYRLGPGKLIPFELDVQLVQALSYWANSQDREIEVELCLDPRREIASGKEPVMVFAADPGSKADGMIVGKVSHRVYTQDSCLVITSDEELRMRVAEFQVRCIPVREFVLSAHTNPPKFARLPAKIPRGIMPPASTQPAPQNLRPPKPQFIPTKDRDGLKQRGGTHSIDEYDRLVAQTLASRNPSTAEADLENGTETTSKPPDRQEIQILRLTLHTWPVQQGAKFLQESFCPEHFAGVADLFLKDVPFKSADLPFLANLLFEHCANEADFISRGGSLMDRLRLALLKSAGMSLTFSEAAQATGDNLSNLRHKARQNAGRWVAINTIIQANAQKEA